MFNTKEKSAPQGGAKGRVVARGLRTKTPYNELKDNARSGILRTLEAHLLAFVTGFFGSNYAGTPLDAADF